MTDTVQPAYILHHYPYQNHGVLLKLLTAEGAVVSAIAKGAKRPRSAWYGLVRPLLPLHVLYAGRGQVKTVRQLEAMGHWQTWPQLSLLAGFYCNELLLHFIKPDDPHPLIFQEYQACLQALPLADDAHQVGHVLRRLEWQLFAELGYAPSLQQDAAGAPVRADAYYRLHPGHLPQRLAQSAIDVTAKDQYGGAALLAIAADDWETPSAMRDLQRLLRAWVDYYLDGKVIKSRQLLRDFYRDNR